MVYHGAMVEVKGIFTVHCFVSYGRWLWSFWFHDFFFSWIIYEQNKKKKERNAEKEGRLSHALVDYKEIKLGILLCQDKL